MDIPFLDNEPEEIPEIPTPTELTEEQIDAAIEKRFGVKSSELVKKADQTKVLTPEEKTEAEENRRKEIIKHGLDHKVFTTKEYEEYLSVQQSDKIELLRRKYVSDHPDDKRAARTFDKIYRLDEEDQFEDDTELPVINEEKKASKELLDKLADEYIDNKYGKIKNASKGYERFQEEQAVIKENTDMVARAINEIPKNIEIKTGRDTYSVPVSKEDFDDAVKMVSDSGILTKKGNSQAEIKDTIALFLKAKNMQAIIDEVEKVAVERAVDQVERGKSGIEVKRQVAPAGNSTAFEEFNRKHGIT